MAPSKAPKKKITTHLKADNIDNTASIKNILDELLPKNAQAYQFYSYLLRQRRTSKYVRNCHFAVPGHPLNAFSEDWDGTLNINYFEQFPYKSLAPRIVTNIRNIDKSDPVTKYMADEVQWQHVLDCFKSSACQSQLVNKYEYLNEEVVRCPKQFVDMAAHLDSKPDPYFESTYNWYYAGNGNMQLVCLDWIDYLLYSEFNRVFLSQFNKYDIIIKTDDTAMFKCDDDENILETISCNKIVALRTKQKVYILRILMANDEIQFEKLKIIRSELPYTSVSFDNHHKNILYITTLDHKLSIINLDRMKARSVTLKAKPSSLVDNWNSVIGSGREIYTHVTRKSISIYDKRNNNTINVWKEMKNVADELTCNDITIAKHFEDTPYLYFGTDHHLFLLDLRYRQNNKLKVVQRWLHGMESVPTYITHCPFEYSKDLICLSSQWCEDMCVVPNYNDRFIKDTDSGGMTIPYRPPSILDAFNAAKQRMLCCDLYNPIDIRLRTAITGHLILEQGEKYNVLQQNSLGDITCHTIFPEHLETFIEDDSVQRLHEWSQNYKLEKSDFEVTSVVNIAKIMKKLRQVPPDYKISVDLLEQNTKFDEQEIIDIFKNEEIEPGLEEVWVNSDQPTVDQSSLDINLHYSDDEK